MYLHLERITQSVVKSHLETCQYSTEELKRMAWSLYTAEETRTYQTKVSSVQVTHDNTTDSTCFNNNQVWKEHHAHD